MTLTAGDIMTTDLITVTTQTSLEALAKVLYDNHINGVPVVDEEGALLGIICESDLIRKDKQLHIPTVMALFDAVFYLERPSRIKEEIERFGATTVGDLYTKKPVTVDKDTSIEEIATLMTEKKIYTIPVMDGDRLVGIIGKADLLRTFTA
jgi:predicted transcriptional regulator